MSSFDKSCLSWQFSTFAQSHIKSLMKCLLDPPAKEKIYIIDDIMHFSYMGWYHCSACDEGKSMSHDDFQSCCRYRDESCRYRNESFLCDSCYEDRKRKDCGKCGSNFCENHGNVELTKCCDQFLCKSCNEDGDLFLCDICCNEDGDEEDDDGKSENTTKTVSYTHLTLPTN